MLTTERRRDQHGRFLPEASMPTIEIERRIGAEPAREKTMRDTYLAAIRILEEHGWCQEAYEDADGSYCIAGALRAAGDSTDQREDGYIGYGGFNSAEANLDRYVRNRFGLPNTEEWNDAPGRTQEQAIALLRLVASFLEETPGA